MELEIRPMNRGTVEAVAALEKQCFSDPWSLRALREELVYPHSVFFTAFCGGQLAGYAGMRLILDEGHITNVAVDPAFRRRGIAASLMARLAAHGRARGLALLTLEVRASNAAAIALYEGLGYERVGLRPGYYRNPAEDALLMTLRLDDGRPGENRGERGMTPSEDTRD